MLCHALPLLDRHLNAQAAFGFVLARLNADRHRGCALVLVGWQLLQIESHGWSVTGAASVIKPPRFNTDPPEMCHSSQWLTVGAVS